MSNLIKLFSPYLVAASILVLINLLFFSPELSGKVLHQPDMIKNAGAAHEARTHHEKTGRLTYWTNSMFGGMPTYQIYAPSVKTSLFDYLVRSFSLFFNGTLKYYLILSLASFIGLCFLGIGPWLSLIGACSIALATNHINLASAGHLTKIATLGFIPLIITGVYLLFNDQWKTGFWVFTFGLAGCVRMNHIQMTYYVALILMFYVLAEIITRIRENKLHTLILPGLALVVGIFISFMVNFSVLMGLRSYAKDTMRGGSILNTSSMQKVDVSTASGTSGLGWDYAMQWSEGITDLLTLVVPGAVGGSSIEPWSQASPMADAFRKNGTPITSDFTLPLYWGDLPFTNGPDYLGILIVLTFIMGLVLVHGPFKWFALCSAVFIMLQSLGYNFSLLNKTLFEYLPYYDKFRAPNSILNVLAVVVPVFSMYSIFYFIQQSWTKETILKLFKKTLFPLAGLLIVLILAGPSLFDMRSEMGDPDWKNNSGLYNALLNSRASYLRSDSLRSLVILILGGGLLYFFGVGKIKKNDFLLAFGLVIVFDLWIVAKRYVHGGSFQQETVEASNYQPRPVDREILKDTSLSYRVLDLSVNTFGSAFPSFFHKAIGGESPAKLRRCQDMIDFYFSKKSMPALNMMNTKYLISSQGALKPNPDALGNAWFISKVKKVNSPEEEIEAVAHLNPAEEAILLVPEFNTIQIARSYSRQGNIRLTQYLPDQLTYQSSTDSAQLAVFSEVWYGPDKGWYALIDGQPAEHFRANYLLRAMQVPAGDHKIEFKFEPREIVKQQNISFYSGWLFGLLLLASLASAFKSLINTVPPIIQQELPPIKPTSVSSKSKSIK